MMKTVATLILLVVMVGCWATPSFTRRREVVPENRMVGANLTSPELIEAYGYPVEIHHVVTEDGFILELHRIPHGLKARRNNLGEAQRVAYLHHGILGSSADWLMNSPDEALAYILAEEGYDVWMANARGNTYSRNHTSLNPDQAKFWQFTWDDMGQKDATSDIDYILATTGQEQLYYVGYSMGCSIYLAMLSDNPEYADKIITGALMAPASYMTGMKGALTLLTPYAEELDTILNLLGYHEFLPGGEWWDEAMQLYCDPSVVTEELCENVLFVIGGADHEEINSEYLPVILAHFPAGTSTHNLIHYAQLANSKVFGKFDWGTIGNLNHYGQRTPPLYNLSNIVTPTALFWGQNDYLADPTDVARLASELPNLTLNHMVSKPEFSHLDFTWAIHANELVYQYVVEYLANY
ncbi:unnamed protein product [Meganyctiphanes norvegica]|uniref:Lipase n=1 Tax=Meganyctiphanes norvegica TaxID=48144 RepID=A0AAV2R7U8_MEGNR